MYKAFIVEVKELREHSNADRLQIATFFGNDVCVDLNTHIGDIGIYFPTDGQLSVEFAEVNNLLRKKNENGENIGGYMDPNKRNVTTIRLRGEKSDGLYLPLACLASFGDIATLTVGDAIDTFNSHQICQKYIPAAPVRNSNKVKDGNYTRKKRAPIAPLFAEHADTEQLAYNMEAFKPGDEVEITLKMHGTSQRTGYLPTLKGYKRTLWDIITRKEDTPIYDWGYVTGTRRTVCSSDFDGGFYGSNHFREQHAKQLEGKLWKGETVYYEVVGYTDSGSTIMGIVDNKKTGDKEFVKQYGKTTTFSYGCEPGTSDFYVYRMTMTNEDGAVVEYTPDFMRYRCEQMGVKTVPVFDKFIVPDTMNSTGVPCGEYVKAMAEQYYDGSDPVGKTHVREGVVCRIINRPKFCAYKHKNFYFKCLEGIAKANAEAPDMEEAQEVING